MKKLKKVLIIVLSILVVLILGVGIGGGNYMVNYSIGSAGGGGDRKVKLDVEQASSEAARAIAENKASQKILTDAFLAAVPEKKVSIKSKDGFNLKGYEFLQEDSHNWAITIHGYRKEHSFMYDYAQNFYARGYNVFLPDLRSCGESESEFLGMGWLDKNDILLWIDYILEQDPQAKIIVHGISMGGATVMMLSGEKTPDAVVAFIEDCGYTRVWDVFSSELKLRFHLPNFPILTGASAVSKVRAKYSFKEASSLKQLKKSDKPMLFFHGTVDNFIAFETLDKVYNAKKNGTKKMVVAEGAGHIESIYLLGQTYWDEIFTFVDSVK